ncbi:MAG: DUF5320 domain-containing protein [Candidatus Woesearchaeota archaeon]
MPRGDGTGPSGEGPRTGRGLGFCNGYERPGFASDIPSETQGFPRGMRRGFRHGSPIKETEPSAGENRALKQEIDRLKDHVEDLERRLGEIDER